MFLPCFLNQAEIERFGEGVEASGRDFQTTVFPQLRAFRSAPQLFSRLQKGGWTVVLASSGKRREVEGTAAVFYSPGELLFRYDG